MEETTLTAIPSGSPCSLPSEAKTEDYVESAVEQWLEKETVFPGVRVWQVVGIVLAVLLGVVVGLCCCVRFRVPRTKQEIEADYIRKKITRNFRHELSRISNKEMDEMDLRKALDRIRSVYERDTVAIAKECTNSAERSAQQGFRSRFNAVFGRTRVRFSPREHAEASAII